MSTLFKEAGLLIQDQLNRFGSNGSGAVLFLQSKLKEMQNYYEMYIQNLKSSHYTELQNLKNNYQATADNKYLVMIEQLKSNHSILIAKLNYEKDQALKALAEKVAMDCKSKYESIINQVNINAEGKINNLMQKLADLNARYDESQSTVAERNALISEMEKTHKQTLEENKKIIEACSSEVKTIMEQTDLKAQRNKKLALGGAGVIGAYLMMKD